MDPFDQRLYDFIEIIVTIKPPEDPKMNTPQPSMAAKWADFDKTDREYKEQILKLEVRFPMGLPPTEKMFKDELLMHRGINLSMRNCQVRRTNLMGWILSLYKKGYNEEHPEMMKMGAIAYIEYEKLLRNLSMWIDRFPEQPAALRNHPVNVVCQGFKDLDIKSIWTMPYGKKRFDRVAAAIKAITHGNFDPLSSEHWVVNAHRVPCKH